MGMRQDIHEMVGLDKNTAAQVAQKADSADVFNLDTNGVSSMIQREYQTDRMADKQAEAAADYQAKQEDKEQEQQQNAKNDAGDYGG